MKLQLSTRLEGVVESSTLKMNAAAQALAAEGVQVCNLTAGEPDAPVPDSVKKAAVDAVQNNFSRYTAVSGIIDLRKGIAKKLKTDNKTEYAPDEIVVTTGAKQAIFNFLLAVISPGDEVIVPAPYWVSYPEMVKIAGGVPVIVPTTEANMFKMSPQDLKMALTPRTKALFLNSPSNPTGTVYSPSEMKALAKVLEGTDVLVVSDEIYEKLVYDGEFASFASMSADAHARTLTVNGFSKTYSMTGWRLGYAAGPKPLISAMTLLQGQSTSNPNSVAQKAGLAALELKEADLAPMRETLRKRRDAMMAVFAQSKDLTFAKPAGAFYLFLNVERVFGRSYNHDGILSGSEDLAFYLLNAAHVGTVAGRGFGSDAHLRLSFAVADRELNEGCQRILKALSTLH